MSYEIKIIPKHENSDLTINRVLITSVAVTPFKGASISVMIYYSTYESSNIYLGKSQTMTIPMPASDYLKYKGNDDYLISYVLLNLGLTKA